MKDFLHETIPDWSCSDSCGEVGNSDLQVFVNYKFD